MPRAAMFLATVLLLVPAAADAQLPDTPLIVAQGDAMLKRAPDRAWIGIATDVRDGRAAEARRKSAEAMTAVQAAVQAAGIPADAIRTTGFAMVPEMGLGYTGSPTVRRYVVRNQIEVRVDDLDRLAEVIDAANSPKNVAITIGSPRFDLKNREAAELEAAQAAVKSAMARARAIVAGAGQTLGAIVRIQQGGISVSVPGPPPAPRTFSGAGRGGGAADAIGEAAIETPITPGELEIRAQVTVTVGIRGA
jgi:uncharacterized protein